MKTKDKILHYFRDINYVYNDSRKYDILKAGLEEIEKEYNKDISCNSCKNYAPKESDE